MNVIYNGQTKLEDGDERGSWGLLKEQAKEKEQEKEEIYKDQAVE